MVFSERTLEEMLADIEFDSERAEVIEWRPRGKLELSKSYLIHKMNFITPDISNIFCRLCDTLNHRFKLRTQRHYSFIGNYFNLSEFVSNALNWGGGLKDVKLYLAPNGVVVGLIQNKAWPEDKRKETIEKINQGLYPSSREGTTDKDSRSGGCGLMFMDKYPLEVSYIDNSTLILLKQEVLAKGLETCR